MVFPAPASTPVGPTHSELNQVMELWRYPSVPACIEARQKARGVAEWRACIAKIAPLVQVRVRNNQTVQPPLDSTRGSLTVCAPVLRRPVMQLCAPPAAHSHLRHLTDLGRLSRCRSAVIFNDGAQPGAFLAVAVSGGYNWCHGARNSGWQGTLLPRMCFPDAAPMTTVASAAAVVRGAMRRSVRAARRLHASKEGTAAPAEGHSARGGVRARRAVVLLER